MLLVPTMMMAQSTVTKKNGTYTIDFSKKKRAIQDTSATQQSDEEDGDSIYIKHKRAVKVAKALAAKKHPAYHYDFQKEGLFKGLFIAGLNGCQIDGDNEYGYKYLGAEVGVGVLVRFHDILSASLEIDYTMKGAKDRFLSTPDISRYYQVQWDYISIPVALNIHIKEIVMFDIGLAPSVMTRYKEFNQDGINVTGQSPYGSPHRFDLAAFTGIHFIIKKHYALGFKYSYSTISIRHAGSGTHVNGQYNNVLTFRFVYILSQLKKK